MDILPQDPRDGPPLPKTLQIYWPWLTKGIRLDTRIYEGGIFTTAYGGDREVGWIEYIVEDNPEGKRVEVLHIVVSPRYRRLGVGSILAKHVKEYTKTIGATHVYLRAFDDRARRFWESQGWVADEPGSRWYSWRP